MYKLGTAGGNISRLPFVREIYKKGNKKGEEIEQKNRKR
jgi:hypothetical protein